MNYLRAKTRAALKGHWQTALLIALVVNLPSLLAEGIAAYTGNDPVTWLTGLVTAASRDGMLTESLLAEQTAAFFRSSGFLTIAVLNAVAWLVTPCLTLGMYRWQLNRLRGEEEPVGTVFCRVPQFFKALGLRLLLLLKILLWTLPGFALCCLFLFLMMRNGSALLQTVPMARYLVEPVFLILISLMAAPAVLAALRYALAEYLLADLPDTRVTECVRVSKKLMRRHLRPLFLLMLFSMMWLLAATFASSVFSGIASGVITLMLQMLAGLVQTAYVGVAVGAYYLGLAEAAAARKHAEEKEAVEDPELTDRLE